MNLREPGWMLGIGLVLLLIGFALPALMILQMIPSTLLLNFIAYGASLVGLSLGMYGSLQLYLRNRRK